jgi:tetratricopeptide (TPR) repeat protein
MCNYRCIDRFFIARRMSVFLPALIFFAAGCFPISAQMSSGTLGYHWHIDEFDTMFERGRFDGQGAPVLDSAFPNQVATPAPVETKVSVDELRHPLTERARRILAAAWRYAQKDEHARAISTLREGMAKVAALVPYAHALLGIEYLRTGRNAEAVPEFTEAVSLFPHDAVAHSNFGVALSVTGQFDRAEQEARLALYLDPALNSAQELLRMLKADETAQSRR